MAKEQFPIPKLNDETPILKKDEPEVSSVAPKSPEDIKRRKLELAALYQGGATLDEIGKEIGLSRQRVWQLVESAGFVMPNRGSDRNLTVDPLKLLELADGTRTAKEIAAELQVKEPTVRYLIRKMELPLMDSRKKHSKEELLGRLRELASELGKTPSAKDLSSYGTNEGIYRYYFGSLRDASKAAGLKPNPIGRPKAKNK